MPVLDLQFDEATHTYSLGGRVLPGVTQVLEDVGIIDYSMIPGETREMALERGRHVHLMTQFDDENELDESTVSPALMPYLQAWRSFRQGWKFEKIEYRMHHSFGYAGTLDRAGIIDGGSYVLDIKTNLAPWWVRIQLAAYRGLLDEREAGSPRRFVVELHNDSTFRLMEFPLTEHRNDFNTFLGALRVFQEKQQHQRKGM